jgi:hypothetical protein
MKMYGLKYKLDEDISYVYGRSFEQKYSLVADYLDQTIHNILTVMSIS